MDDTTACGRLGGDRRVTAEQAWLGADVREDHFLEPVAEAHGGPSLTDPQLRGLAPRHRYASRAAAVHHGEQQEEQDNLHHTLGFTPSRFRIGKELVEPRQRGLEQRRRDVRVFADEVLEAGAVEGDAANVRLRPHARGAGAVLGQQRELAEEVARAELTPRLTGLDLDGPLDDEEHPAAGRRLDGLVLELLLGLLHLALHLLHLLEHLVHVEAHSGSTSRASRVPLISSMISSSLTGSSSSVSVSPPFSPTSNASSRW